MKNKNHFSSISFFRILQNYRRSILLCVLFSTFTLPAFSQQKVPVESVSDFYKSLQSIQSNAKTTSPKYKALKIKSGQSLNVSISAPKKSKDVVVFTGKVANSKESHVYFTFEDGNVTGKVILPATKEAYSYTSQNGMVYVVPVDIRKVLCIEYQKANTVTSPHISSPAPPPTSIAYTLESLPGANAVVMLDFDGHNTDGSWWGAINALPADVSEADITDAWRVISEDFRPYQLNITTNENVYQSAPSDRRMRVIFTPTTDAAPGSGGVAFIGVFTTGGELAPCWVYNIGSGKIMGETASHEIGHTMGLVHDGREIPDQGHEEYYGGQGDWAPIMGVSYYREVSHWSKGEYQYANNSEDDISIIGSNNGFTFRSDVQGSSIATATPLVVNNGTVAAQSNYGIINNNGDLDFFSFTSQGGNLNLTISPAPYFPNLNIIATLYDHTGQIITSSNPPGLSAAVFNLNLATGTYYIGVDGTGEGDPFSTGYSDYSSIGEYSIAGNIVTVPNNCNDYIQQLSNGDVKFSVTYPVQKAYVEVFARKNGQQNIAVNIVGSQVFNGDGTYTYSLVVPGSNYNSGDVILARFYSYSTGGPGIFTPGPTDETWSSAFVYNQTNCTVVSPPNACSDYVQELSNGNIRFLVTYPVQKSYVEVFAKKNGQQNIAVNIVGSQVNNADGTFSYSYYVPASTYATGDIILARFYSYSTGGPGIFTPGPSDGVWSSPFIYNQSTCQSCNDIYETNESIAAAKLIPVNSTINAQINTASDQDWFKITTTNASPNLQVTLTNLVVDFDVALYDVNGNYLTGSFNGGAISESFNYSNTSAATYFIKVYGYIGNNSTQCYALHIGTSGAPFARMGVAETKDNMNTSSFEGLRLYPNPVKSGMDLIVEMKSQEEGMKTFKIIDLNGHVISEQNISVNGGSARLNLSGIEAGMYILDAGNLNKQKLVIE
jgi:hypothetical protein